MEKPSVFFSISPDNHIITTDHFFVIRDGYPVSPGHSLIITKQLRRDYFELSEEELQELPAVIKMVKANIEESHRPDGYNLGMNCGQAAGQTVFHFHCHVIPRYLGDMESPRGGVRHCVAGKGDY
ncbi:HIT family protein [Hymenobacter busanensis]|uniref:HIT family protein n=1 Tax=Hymenobacter busanensis TaxID=2607656 RepID=A0A7L4ZUN7_9BACT|nr:HIT family protein [Hymenobacter busanensis]KAA9327226.1 HIT family protein [Hymenobacter busanensis]QHJ05892.1 HIT domain-containing protein [Hymenobacter busanensis]